MQISESVTFYFKFCFDVVPSRTRCRTSQSGKPFVFPLIIKGIVKRANQMFSPQIVEVHASDGRITWAQTEFSRRAEPFVIV